MTDVEPRLRMLSTDAAWYAINGCDERFDRRLQGFDPRRLCISTMTRAELSLAACEAAGDASIARIQAFLRVARSLPWDAAAADRFGELCHDHVKSGFRVGISDLGVAAHAETLGAILVTRDAAAFAGIGRRLQIEEWR